MIKELVYNWKINGAKKKKASRKNIGFDKAQKIGILFDNDANYQRSKAFISSLTNDGKTVQLLIKSTEKEPPSDQHFTEKQCSWTGNINSNAVKKFISTPFDYLFMLNKDVHYLNEYILSASKAHCRVGVHDENKEELFELMFDNGKNEPYDKFFHTVKNYLDKIKTD